MRSRIFTIKNKAGIHCRPSSVILNAIKNEFPDHLIEVVLESGKRAEINSILTLLSLELACGVTATLCVEGIDEDKAVQRLGDLFEQHFDFPPMR